MGTRCSIARPSVPGQFFQICAFAKVCSSLVMPVSSSCGGPARQNVVYQGLVALQLNPYLGDRPHDTYHLWEEISSHVFAIQRQA